MTPAQIGFVSAILPYAVEASKRIGVDPRIIVGQAALETGWGEHAPGNNLFGIKGPGQTLATTEVVDGRPVATEAIFRQYASPGASVADYADFIAGNPRYRPLMEADGLDAQLEALGESGYATDPAYAEKVGRIARGIQVADSGQTANDGNRAALLQEAVRRGLISRDALMAEARKRGLIGDGGRAAENPPPSGMTPNEATEAAIRRSRAANGETMPLLRGASPGMYGLAKLFLNEQEQRNLDSLNAEAVKGLTGGWIDELAGWLSAAPKEVKRRAESLFGMDAGPSTFSEDAARERARVNAPMEAFEQKHPYAATGAQIVGAAAGLGAAPSLTSRAAGAIPKTILGATEGATYGALVGAGEAEPGERLAGVEAGAVGGAIAGGVLTRAGVSLDRFLNARALAKAAHDLDALKAQSQRLFSEADRSGVVYKPQAVQGLADNLVAKMEDRLITEGLHGKAFPLYKRLTTELAKDQPLTLGRLTRLRQLAAGAAYDAKKGEDAMLARQMVDMLDDFSTNEANMAVAGRGAEAQKEARALWAQYRKAATIEKIIDDAVLDTAATGSGGNINNNIRRGIRNLVKNPKRMAGFTPEERMALRRAVRPGQMQDFLRLVGKLSPSGNGLMAALQGGAAVSSGGLTIPLAIGAHAAKLLADYGTTKRAERVLQIILSGGDVPQSTLAKLTAPERRALSRAIAGSLGQEIGGPALDRVRTSAESGR